MCRGPRAFEEAESCSRHRFDQSCFSSDPQGESIEKLGDAPLIKDVVRCAKYFYWLPLCIENVSKRIQSEGKINPAGGRYFAP
jgi:hypothetical protein